ncbi:MAG: dipeptide ABC transporter ATP-binding protein, partial [Chloroflexota bacterium]
MTTTNPTTPLTGAAQAASVDGARDPTRGPVLEVQHLSVDYATGAGTVEAVRDVSLSIQAGETLGIVGESGCGKSTLAFAVMGYLGENGHVSAGSIRLHGQELTGLPRAELRRLRGARMAMVYQDPQTALNPAIVVGEQVAEARRVHSGEAQRECWRRAVEMLGRVGLPDPEGIARRYPHQLSGGQQQRVVIAMALVNDPDLLIMDEPTTGLDVTTEALILDLVNRLKQEFNAAILYISHNLGVIAQVCDRVAVMYAGEVAEEADVQSIFRNPRHPYTVGLLGCVPRLGTSKATGRLQSIPGHLPPRTARPEGCVYAPRCGLARDYCREVAPDLFATDEAAHHARCHFWPEVPDWASRRSAEAAALATDGKASRVEVVTDHATPAPEDGALAAARATKEPLLEVRDLRRYFGGRRGVLGRLLGQQPRVRAVDRVSFEIAPGETLALIGESGCGKTTLARTIAGLLKPSGGEIRFMGQDVTATAGHRPAALRRDLQMVFQNPDASLNPRHTVGQIIERPVQMFLGLRGTDARRRVIELLRDVQLDPTYYHRYPAQLSGGEKQRVSIARAFAGDPRLVICDEAVSSLDVSVQAAIL